MSEDYNKPAFKKLLQKLQEESWQLELLISGFAIFGLFSAFPALKIALNTTKTNDNFQLGVILIIALSACSILIFNLLLHVLLRGLWIGALGLRYVSGDIDYERLNYSNKFDNYLRKKVGSFDKYIARLENYCSIIFAISFLLIFYVLAYALTITAIGLTIYFFLQEPEVGSILTWIGVPILVFFIVGMLLTFFDFITLGFLKKKNWISKIYFPIYWVFSFITLSFLYRPLVYNFLDNKFGRRLSFFLVPIYLALLFIITLNYNHSNYFSFEESSGSRIANSENYEDQIIDDSDFISEIAINSKVITNSFVKVFIVYSKFIEDDIYDFNTELKPEKDERGVTSNFINIDLGSTEKVKEKNAFFDTFNTMYSVEIDSVTYNAEFILGKSIKKQNGFETYIGIKNLNEGKHLLIVKRKEIKDSDTIIKVDARIPFWYYPD